jgi:hypothetical protein
MFGVMETIIPIFFIVVIGIILLSVYKNISEWRHNNQQPVLTVPAKIVSKRTKMSRSSHNHNGHHHHSTHSSYYATFEVESKDRMELKVNGREYGLLAEGDQGQLTFQGTRYHKFERQTD